MREDSRQRGIKQETDALPTPRLCGRHRKLSFAPLNHDSVEPDGDTNGWAGEPDGQSWQRPATRRRGTPGEPGDSEHFDTYAPSTRLRSGYDAGDDDGIVRRL